MIYMAIYLLIIANMIYNISINEEEKSRVAMVA